MFQINYDKETYIYTVAYEREDLRSDTSTKWEVQLKCFQFNPVG